MDKSALKRHKSVCRFCGTGCDVQLGRKGKKLLALRGDPEHPIPQGIVCAKALFLPKMATRKTASPNRRSVMMKNSSLPPAAEHALTRLPRRDATIALRIPTRCVRH
ncbi:MAG: hypothetical protein GXP24_00140 [Planctomycetes bacterium]|nr:hypothetical protein [Planctomycetota bacterium]